MSVCSFHLMSRFFWKSNIQASIYPIFRETNGGSAHMEHLPTCMMKSTYQVDPVQLWSWYASSSHEGASIFPHIKDILCSCIRGVLVARQQSLISNALFLTFATIWYYQKCLDVPGVTFRPWVRYTVSILRATNAPPPKKNTCSAFMEMLRKHRVGIRWVEMQKIKNTSKIFILFLVIFFILYRYIKNSLTFWTSTKWGDKFKWGVIKYFFS